MLICFAAVVDGVDVGVVVAQALAIRVRDSTIVKTTLTTIRLFIFLPLNTFSSLILNSGRFNKPFKVKFALYAFTPFLSLNTIPR
jgi:hypothetical protein